jgi:hypothetical protein
MLREVETSRSVQSKVEKLCTDLRSELSKETVPRYAKAFSLGLCDQQDRCSSNFFEARTYSASTEP